MPKRFMAADNGWMMRPVNKRITMREVRACYEERQSCISEDLFPRPHINRKKESNNVGSRYYVRDSYQCAS